MPLAVAVIYSYNPQMFMILLFWFK